MERYGRFWIWEYYCDATNKSLFDGIYFIYNKKNVLR